MREVRIKLNNFVGCRNYMPLCDLSNELEELLKDSVIFPNIVNRDSVDMDMGKGHICFNSLDIKLNYMYFDKFRDNESMYSYYIPIGYMRLKRIKDDIFTISSAKSNYESFNLKKQSDIIMNYLEERYNIR